VKPEFHQLDRSRRGIERRAEHLAQDERMTEKWRQWEAASKADWGTAVERESVIRALAEEERLTSHRLRGAMRQLNLSRSVVYKLLHRFRQRPKTSSLLPWKRGRGANTRFLDLSREDLLTACIKDFYLVRQQPPLAALFQEVRRRFAEHQLPAPNYRTVVRRVAALDRRHVMAKRQGSKRAREKFGPVGVSTLHPDFPLDVVQIDHTLADVMVVDRERREWIGRPWLTLAIDVASRAVVGFSVSLENPSALSISLALTHAVLPKTSWLADRELQNLDWPMAGLPRLIHVDNAKEFHSQALLRGCQEYSIAIEHRPRRQPHLGGHVERLVGTMMGAVHLLPGTTFSNASDKGSYDSEGRAVLTLPELERWLALQIAGVYHLTVHSALGKTPLEAWREGMAKRKQPLRYPPSAEEFFLDFLPAVPRIVQRDGVHFHQIRYWDNVLSAWAGRLKKPLWVKYDPRNLSRVYVRDLEGQHWPIPYADLRQPPIALWELMEARKRLRQHRRADPTERDLFANILEQRRLVKAAAKSSHQRRRKERIPQAVTIPPGGHELAKRSEQPSQELKPYPVEIWERE
jgi:putative transposase